MNNLFRKFSFFVLLLLIFSPNVFSFAYAEEIQESRILPQENYTFFQYSQLGLGTTFFSLRSEIRKQYKAKSPFLYASATQHLRGPWRGNLDVWVGQWTHIYSDIKPWINSLGYRIEFSPLHLFLPQSFLGRFYASFHWGLGYMWVSAPESWKEVVSPHQEGAMFQYGGGLWMRLYALLSFRVLYMQQKGLKSYREYQSQSVSLQLLFGDTLK